MSIRKVSVAEVAEINPRLEAKDRPRPEDMVTFAPMASVSEVTLSIVTPECRAYREVAKGFTPFRRGDIIVAKITPCFENGKMANTLNLPHEFGFGSTEFHVFRPQKSIYGSYLFHLLRSPTVRESGQRKMKGAAGQKRVPADFFASLQIPLPPLAEQKRIAGILDAADALRAKRREALAQLDTLLQSTFLDMFGDPVTNPKGWDVRQLKESGVEVKVGPFGSLLHKADYIPGGIPLINPKHIVDGSIEHSGDESVSTSKANELQEYLLKEGDVLLARRGEMGRCVIIRAAHENWLCGTGSVIVRVTSNLYDPEFLAAAFSSQQMRKHLENLSGGAIMPSLSGTQIKTLPLLVPPRSKQNEFSLFIKLLKAQKSRMQAHLAELGALFASLQSRAFNGEL